MNLILRNRNIEAQFLEELMTRPGIEWSVVRLTMVYMLQSYERAVFPELNLCRRELKDKEFADFVHPSEVKGYSRPTRVLVFQPWPTSGTEVKAPPNDVAVPHASKPRKEAGKDPGQVL